MGETQWVAVRHVVIHPSGGTHDRRYFEERITMWLAPDIEAGVALAEAEVAKYCSDLGLVDAGLYQGYLVADDVEALTTGFEVFSLIRGSDLMPEAYLDRFFDTGDEIQGTIAGAAEPSAEATHDDVTR